MVFARCQILQRIHHHEPLVSVDSSRSYGFSYANACFADRSSTLNTSDKSLAEYTVFAISE
jgi:hypothetical protein